MTEDVEAMVTVLGSLLFALPTSLLLCVTRGMDLLQGSSVVLAALVSIPAVATCAILVIQAVVAPQRHARRAACNLMSSAVVAGKGWVRIPPRVSERV